MTAIPKLCFQEGDWTLSHLFPPNFEIFLIVPVIPRHKLFDSLWGKSCATIFRLDIKYCVIYSESPVVKYSKVPKYYDQASLEIFLVFSTPSVIIPVYRNSSHLKKKANKQTNKQNKKHGKNTNKQDFKLPYVTI